MVSRAHHPAVYEALELVHEVRDTRLAALADARLMCGTDIATRLRTLMPLFAVTPQDDSRFIETLPAVIRQHLTDHDDALRRLQRLYDEHTESLDLARREHTAALRHAVMLHRAERARRTEQAALARIPERASAAGRDLTPAEMRYLDKHRTKTAALPEPVSDDDVLRLLGNIRVREAAAQLRAGLLLTDQMRRIIAESLPSLRLGEPQLFIGETGGAKTALADHLARMLVGTGPEFVSGYGDITSAQVIGAHELRAHEGATLTEFVPGPLLRAMLEGTPIILDELNAMPPEFLKRLNRILQLRPGAVFSVQENAGASVRIREGFVILATANEQSGRRYRGIEPLSAELLNRFGAHTFRVRYPDASASVTEVPRENLFLATAAASLPDGRLPRHLSTNDMLRIARAAFMSQQIFSGATGHGFDDYVSTAHTIDGRPGLEESVLAPRTLVSLVEKVARSAGAVSLDHAVQRFIEGVMHQEDRRVLSMILRGQGFAVTDV